VLICVQKFVSVRVCMCGSALMLGHGILSVVVQLRLLVDGTVHLLADHRARLHIPHGRGVLDPVCVCVCVCVCVRVCMYACPE
jgi:predicted Co/Zn/Cd cation transporter (cation efflux family)